MPKAVILHGTNGSPAELQWTNWIKKQLEQVGYGVWFPQLPDCDKPNLKTYDAFFKNSGWNFEDNLIIGHSSGATALLHLLQQAWFPRSKAAVFVGTFLNERLLKNASWYVRGQFDALFAETFEIENIKSGAKAFYFVHGDDDPYCDFNEAKVLCKKLGGTFISIPNAGHLGKSSTVTALPELIKKLREDNILI
ncbi:MAG: serine hydrolase [Patescibacteria group bacterium]|nr:alpha/beta hydrolase [Candidatus Saccharibacteria bacterium]MDQ5963227.1 serine hydrolase [Patescibacteria group bacterium]